MKKIVVALVAIAMVFAFTACENKTEVPADEWAGVGVRIAKHINPEELAGGADCEGNWDHISEATYADGVITVKADVNAMDAYASTNPEQAPDGAEFKWYALFVSVGEDLVDDETLKIQGSTTLAEARGDVNKYTTADDDAPASDEFVLWCKAESEGKLTLSRDGAEDLVITIKVVDTPAEAE